MVWDDLILDVGRFATGLAFLALAVLTCNLLVMSVLHFISRRRDTGPAGVLPPSDALPAVLVQLPVYNELEVVCRAITAAASLDWPRERLRIQVLDDSTDETGQVVASLIGPLRAKGLDIHQVRRSGRAGYKAGALANGLSQDDSPYVVIFDADFVPAPDFLKRSMPSLLADNRLAFVQARWEHLNAGDSTLTAAQAAMIDAHFAIEQRVRCRSGLMLPFNGTCGVWRRAAIDAAGGWSPDTLCEDLDLSIRARLAGWAGVFRGDITVPGELPTTLASWRAQQFRWTKGFAQVARKLLGEVWRSPLPLSFKLALTVQTCQPLCYPLTAISLLGTLAMLIDTNGNDAVLPMLGSVVAILGVSASGVFLAIGRSALSRGEWRRFPRDFASVLLLNAGLMVSNTRAVIEAALGRQSPFTRTPKSGGISAGRPRSAPGANGAAELCTGSALAICLVHAAGWLSPVFSISIGGLLIVGAGLARERWIACDNAAMGEARPPGLKKRRKKLLSISASASPETLSTNP
jgi:cellulose synthase/poly-beta-1,6-N-acetylglucosamine synthase-like glycosyltransferase